MGYTFSADEVFEIAEQIERNGVKFYRQAAEQVGEPTHQKVLEELAAMEVDHEKTFAQMRSELKQNEKQTTVFDPEDEAWIYLKSLADTRVFFKKEIDLTSMEEILKAAIIAEKDSIVFYLGMKEVVPVGKDKLNAIIKEEMGHINLLSSKLLDLN